MSPVAARGMNEPVPVHVRRGPLRTRWDNRHGETQCGRAARHIHTPPDIDSVMMVMVAMVSTGNAVWSSQTPTAKGQVPVPCVTLHLLQMQYTLCSTHSAVHTVLYMLCSTQWWTHAAAAPAGASVCCHGYPASTTTFGTWSAM
eukprot:scpid58328/ scgid2394/ 